MGPNHQAGNSRPVAVGELGGTAIADDIVLHDRAVQDCEVQQADHRVRPRALGLGQLWVPAHRSHPVVHMVGLGVSHQAVIEVHEQHGLL